MKIMKKSLLALALISTTANLVPRGGGFGGGLLAGALITGTAVAATSGSRNNENPQSRSVKSIEKEIRRSERQIESLQRSIDEIKYRNKKKYTSKNQMSEDEKADRLDDLHGQLSEHKENIKSLQKQRAMITA